MRLLFLAAALLACMLTFVDAKTTSLTKSNNMTLIQAVGLMPKCALPCLVTSITGAGCGPTDKFCVCHTKVQEIEDNATPCILKSCSFVDALQSKNLTALSCDAPVRDKRASYDAMAIGLGIFTNLLVLVRVVYKRFWCKGRKLGWDDYLIVIAAWPIGITATLINVLGLTANGMGLDAWTLTPHQINLFGTFFYTMEVLYLAEIAFIKLSLSVFYLYIFPHDGARRLLWGVIALNIVSGIAFVAAALLQCFPISYFWNKYTDPNAKGWCYDISTFGWIHAGLSILVDVVMIAVPLDQLRKLQLNWRKKLGVSLMFLLGTFVTVVSVLRLKSLIFLAHSTNPTWDQWIVAWWSTVEVHVGIVCTCMPTMRLLLVHVWPRAFSTGTTNARSRNKSVTNSANRPRAAHYIMQSKEVTMTSMDIEMDDSTNSHIGNSASVETNYSRPQYSQGQYSQGQYNQPPPGNRGDW